MTSPRPVRGRLLGALAALVLLTLTAACGIGAEDAVHRINPAQLETLGTAPESLPPSPVAARTTTTQQPDSRPLPTSGVPSTVVPVDVVLYYVAGDQLVEVTRSVPPDPSVRQILSLLAQPPEGQGLRTTISAGLISSVYRRGDLETVDLVGELFDAVDPIEQPLLFGQIVLTLSSLSSDFVNISRVEFTLDDAPVRAMRGDSTLAALGASVGRADYQGLLADQ